MMDKRDLVIILLLAIGFAGGLIVGWPHEKQAQEIVLDKIIDAREVGVNLFSSKWEDDERWHCSVKSHAANLEGEAWAATAGEAINNALENYRKNKALVCR
jgi:hypothetical protein